MTGKVIFTNPIILDGLLDFYRKSLGDEKYWHFQKSAKNIRETIGGSDHPNDLSNMPIKFFEKYYPHYKNSYSEVAYRVKYRGYDVLIDDDGHTPKEISILPDELFEIKE